MSRLTNPACLLVLSLVWFSAVFTAHAEDKTGSYVGTLAKDGLWSAYKSQFVKQDGRVVDNVNGGISHSESQGYGMLLALTANDRNAFKTIYAFAQDKLAVRSDALYAWRYDPQKASKVEDLNNASDGDLLIAWSLLEAAEAGWGASYRNTAQDILKDLSPLIIEWQEIGLILKPGEFGFSSKVNAQTANLSYWVFPALERIHTLTGDRRWKRLAASGEQLIDQFVSQINGRIPDWILLEKGSINAKPAPDKAPVFGYEAIRIPLYLLMSDNADKALAQAIINAVQTGNGDKLQQVDVASGKPKGIFSDPGYSAILDLARCQKHKTRFRPSTVGKLDQNYYPATLQLLALVAAKRSHTSCL